MISDELAKEILERGQPKPEAAPPSDPTLPHPVTSLVSLHLIGLGKEIANQIKTRGITTNSSELKQIAAIVEHTTIGFLMELQKLGMYNPR